MLKDTKTNLPASAFLSAGAVGIVTFFAGAAFTGNYLPEKNAFLIGMLAGSISIGGVGLASYAQLAKDRRDELDELNQRLSEAKGDLSKSVVIRDGLQAECHSLKLQVQDIHKRLQVEHDKGAQAIRAYEGATTFTKDLNARLEVAKAELQQWEKTVKELHIKIDELETDNREWEAEFEDRLRGLLEDERADERAKARKELQAKYQQIIKQFEQKKPAHIQKRVDREVARRLGEFQADFDAVVDERDTALANLEAVKGEFAIAVTDLQSELDETELIDRLEGQVLTLQDALETKDRAILELRSRLVKLEEPRYFAHGTKDYRGNKIIDHAKNLGIILDSVGRSRSSDNSKETYAFITRENIPPKDVVTKLNGNPRHLQAELDAIKPVNFEYNPETLHFQATVQVMKERVTRDDIDALWLKSTKWEGLIKNTCAFRVSANKHGAKSPTVRNILGAKLAIGEKFKLRRYDPSGGSEKDYWRVAPTWRTYDQAVAMAGEIHSLIEKRQTAKARNSKASQSFEWVYYVIDELDNTLSKTRHNTMAVGNKEVSEAAYLMSAITAATKEGEHVKIGLIVCTQTPNTWELMESKDVNKAFWNNFSQIFIQANAFNYLGSSVNQNKAPKLSTDFTKVSDWCNDQNENIEDESRKFRPALMVTPNKRVIIELPQLGEYGFDKIDAAENYEFTEFDAYQFSDSRSLDRCLGELRNRTAPAGTTPAPPPHQQAPAEDERTDCKSLQSNVSATLVRDEKQHICPKCGGTLKKRGISDKKDTYGKQKMVCTNKKHTRQIGAKTFYFPSE